MPQDGSWLGRVVVVVIVVVVVVVVVVVMVVKVVKVGLECAQIERPIA